MNARVFFLVLLALPAMSFEKPEELYTDSWELEYNVALVPKKDISHLTPEEQRQTQLEALRSIALEDVDEGEAAKARAFYGEKHPSEKRFLVGLGVRAALLFDPSGTFYNDPAAYYREKGWDSPKGQDSSWGDFFTDYGKRFIAKAKEDWRQKKRQEEQAEDERAEAYWRERQKELATEPRPEPHTLKNWVDAGIDAFPVLTALFVVGVYAFRNRERERLGRGLKRVCGAVCRPVRRAWRAIPADDWNFWLSLVAVGLCGFLAYAPASWGYEAYSSREWVFWKAPFWVYRITHWAVALCAAVSFLRLIRAETTAPAKQPARTLVALALFIVYQPVCGVVSFKQEEWAWVNATTVLLLPFCAWWRGRKQEKVEEKK